MMEFFQMMPVHYVKGMRVLYVGFCEKIEYTVLYAIEQMLDCRTQPCLVGRRALKSVLERIRLKPHPSELVFERLADAAEMARITRSYVLKLGAEAVRAVACGEYVWLRKAPVAFVPAAHYWAYRQGREGIGTSRGSAWLS